MVAVCAHFQCVALRAPYLNELSISTRFMGTNLRHFEPSFAPTHKSQQMCSLFFIIIAPTLAALNMWHIWPAHCCVPCDDKTPLEPEKTNKRINNRCVERRPNFQKKHRVFVDIFPLYNYDFRSAFSPILFTLSSFPFFFLSLHLHLTEFTYKRISAQNSIENSECLSNLCMTTIASYHLQRHYYSKYISMSISRNSQRICGEKEIPRPATMAATSFA